MKRQVDVQYIRFYTEGTSAKKLDPILPKFKLLKPARPRQKKRIRVYIDPIATVGIIVAAVMLVLMAVGVSRLKAAQQEAVVMERYVAALEAENAQLHETYENGYDLETVERLARALGMVPKEELQHIPVSIPAQEPEVVELSFWERVSTFLTELFA